MNKWKQIRNVRKFIMELALNEQYIELYKIKQFMKQNDCQFKLVSVKASSHMPNGEPTPGRHRRMKYCGSTKYRKNPFVHGQFFTKTVLDFRASAFDVNYAVQERYNLHLSFFIERKTYLVKHKKFKYEIGTVNGSVDGTKFKPDVTSFDQRDMCISTAYHAMYGNENLVILYGQNRIHGTNHTRNTRPRTQVRYLYPNVIDLKNKRFWYSNLFLEHQGLDFFTRDGTITDEQLEFMRLPRALKEFEWEIRGGT